MIVFVIHQHELALGIHVSPPSWTLLPPPSPSYPSRLSQSTDFWFPVSCMEPRLAICFTCGNIYVSMLFSHFILLTYSPTMPVTNSASEQAFSIGKIQICSAQSSRIIKHQYHILSNDPGWTWVVFEVTVQLRQWFLNFYLLLQNLIFLQTNFHPQFLYLDW